MDELKQKKQLVSIGDFAYGELTSDIARGQTLDTHVELSLDLWISGNTIEAFQDQLKKLLDEFAI